MGIVQVVALCLLFSWCSSTDSKAHGPNPTTHGYKHNPHEIHPDFDLNPPIQEFVQNQLQNYPDIRLAVHCQSGDDDLGVHILLLREQFSWKFRRNIFGKTLFLCKMAWHDHAGRYAYKSFDTYREYEPLPGPNISYCKQCYWTAREDGIFLNDVKIYTWELYDLP